MPPELIALIAGSLIALAGVAAGYEIGRAARASRPLFKRKRREETGEEPEKEFGAWKL